MDNLPDKILKRADKDKLPQDHELRVAARAFEEVCRGMFAVPQTHLVRQMMGAWAKTRRLWCEYSGEAIL